jgi:hypothetical protein
MLSHSLINEPVTQHTTSQRWQRHRRATLRRSAKEMGLFTRKPKPTPKITIEGIEVSYDTDQNWWEFTYREQEFISFSPQLNMPSLEELNAILSSVATLTPEMLERLEKGWKEWEKVKMDDGESFSINIEDFSREGSFDASWSGGASWGDMGIDFTIKNQKIVDETWGD